MHLPNNTSLTRGIIQHLTALLIACALLACGGEDGVDPVEIPPPGDPILASIGSGSFAPLAGYDSIYGQAHVARALDGQTTFELHVEGLSTDLYYPVHVHAYPCEENDGGGHYKLDPGVAETLEENEIWPTFTTDANGIGRTTLTVTHSARMDAQSIVIHDPENGNAKMACANLTVPYDGMVERAGEMAPFAAAEAIDDNIAGTVQMTSSAQGTEVTASIQGLDSASEYTSHIHVYPCSVIDAGGHYKIDSTVEGTEAANELWPEIVPDASGAAEIQLSSPHNARADAQSMVIHRVTPNGSPKVACANLVRPTFYEFRAEGTTNILPAGEDRGYGDAVVNAYIARRLDGSTAAWIQLASMEPNQDYGVHVHTYSCNTENGGGHYKLDDAIADTVEANEMWLDLTTDSSRIGEMAVTVDHLARPEAQSMVVHDYGDSERIICIDFN